MKIRIGSVIGWVALTIGVAGAPGAGDLDACGAEVVRLTAENWDEYAPAGKEADCIYGDHVLRNDQITAVVGQAIATRHANMTTQRVGGAVIDLVLRNKSQDQLSCYYPAGSNWRLAGPVEWPEDLQARPGAAQLAFEATHEGSPSDGAPRKAIIAYELADGDSFLRVTTVVDYRQQQDAVLPWEDAMRADGEFKTGHDAGLNLWWCYDEHWRSAYGLTADNIALTPQRGQERPFRFRYESDANAGNGIPADTKLVIQRRLYPAADMFSVLAAAGLHQDRELAEVSILAVDDDGPVADAIIEAHAHDGFAGQGRTDHEGQLIVRVPPGDYRWTVQAFGRESLSVEKKIEAGDASVNFDYGDVRPAHVVGVIVDEGNQPIACKVAFFGRDVEDPNFGPDSAVHGVRNLQYTADGRFRVAVLPGEYQLLISRGPEYDATSVVIDTRVGETVEVREQLRRTVKSAGWISAELHSHSSPSGDNTSSQRGRVLNLLAEHLEFIPCTEHQRITTYGPHLKHFEASASVLTCPGMELTGKPLPINHQNAFPLIARPRMQDGGAPVTDVNPITQIARLAMWDEGSDKVVQINHPNIVQIAADANLDGQADDGFRKMFHYADVIEVHPPGEILDPLVKDERPADSPGPRIHDWLRLLNLGYRIPGVVNTDAHWNFHGSGWLRNYVRSSADDPAQANLREVCDALSRGQVVMTNGPFMEVDAEAGAERVGPGDDLTAETKRVTLHVRVECANWLDVNRVQVLVNGRPAPNLNFTRRANRGMFGDGPIKFNEKIALPLEDDAHVIVVAAGEGLQLGKVYGIDRGAAMPVAVANPIFVDVDGNGFQPNGDTLDSPLLDKRAAATQE